MKKCLIIVGGDECDIRRSLSNGFEGKNENLLKNYFIIACDKGLEYAQNQRIDCDLFAGDFDSYKYSVPDNAVVLPTEKDDTDLMFAIKTAIQKECKSIVITCALGGRTDHFISNIQSLVYATEQNVDCRIVDEENEIFAVKNSDVVLPKRDGWGFSVLSHSSLSKGVSIKNAKYKLSDKELTNYFPLGQSNEWSDDDAVVSVADGILLVFLTKLK